MRRRNCYCGLKAHANCTRCGNGVCYMHYNDHDHSSAWFYRNWGQGETLAEAAYVRGYWSATRDLFLCKDCRDADGKRHSASVLQQSRGWQRDPFRFALSGATLGYVITKPGITYAQTIQSWLALNWQPIEVITVRRLTRPEKRRMVRGVSEVSQPARYAEDRYHGWSFPRTICLNTGERTRQDAEVWSWSGTTDILTDGRVLQLGKPAAQLHSSAIRAILPPYRLIVEMARKMTLSRRIEWKGPMENWDT